MQIFPFLVVAWIVAVGLYGLVTSRDLIHQIVCLIVVQSSTYVLLLGVGYVTGGIAPYFSDISPHTKPVVDPVGRRWLSPTWWSRPRSPRCCSRSRSRRTSGSAPSTRTSSPS
jgi:hypothetical protein